MDVVSNICYNELKCKVMEDKVHAIFNCPSFDERQSFFDRLEILIPSFKS